MLNPTRTLACAATTLALAATTYMPTASAALIATPGLQSISFIELTGGASTNTFLSNSSQITQRLGNPLGSQNNDFTGLANEYYDVYYSNADGSFNANGDFISVEARFPNQGGGGGLNMGSIILNFANGSTLRANLLTSFLGLGANYIPGSELLAVDGNDGTASIMGNTGNSETERLRITVGFVAPIPEPSTYGLMALGLAGLGIFARRTKRAAG